MPLKGAVLLKVEWTDSCATHGWERPDALEHMNPSNCISVGWLVRETEDGLAVAPHVSNVDASDERVDGVLMIPKVAIISREEIG